ncbi:MAG: DinB family protein [Gemmatimonadaceae bacterium]
MRIVEMLQGEFTNEAAQTRKVLERIPFDKVDYKPHEKSMTLGKLAGHVADLTGWTGLVMTATELDLGGGYVTPPFSSIEELLSMFDTHVEATKAALMAANDEELGVNWTLRAGSHVIMTMPRGQIVRGMCFNHIVHHRGQLTVYLRLIGVPVPGLYGPSADEM